MGQGDGKEPKRACVVLSQGREVVEPGYSTMSSAAATGKDKGMHWDNPNQVTQVTDKGRNPDNSNLSYSVFMPKPSTHRMHDPGLIVPHIRPKVLTDNQIL
jgi:hypothetical protein